MNLSKLALPASVLALALSIQSARSPITRSSAAAAPERLTLHSALPPANTTTYTVPMGKEFRMGRIVMGYGSQTYPYIKLDGVPSFERALTNNAEESWCDMGGWQIPEGTVIEMINTGIANFAITGTLRDN